MNVATYYLLNDLEWASISSGKITFYSNKGKEIIKEKNKRLKMVILLIQKIKYDHFMLKRNNGTKRYSK